MEFNSSKKMLTLALIYSLCPNYYFSFERKVRSIAMSYKKKKRMYITSQNLCHHTEITHTNNANDKTPHRGGPTHTAGWGSCPSYRQSRITALMIFSRGRSKHLEVRGKRRWRISVRGQRRENANKRGRRGPASGSNWSGHR
jgi:hypothetical protein